MSVALNSLMVEFDSPRQRGLAKPENTANLVAFVDGPNAAYLSGENINVDGRLRHIGSEQLPAAGDNGNVANRSGGGMRVGA
jgi:hypothetical protein